MTEFGDPASGSPSFNLLDEPWIPIRWIGGRSGDVGLHELLQQAPHIAAIAEPSAPSFLALHRLLLAVVHRALTKAFGSWTDESRARWSGEDWPADAMTRYLAAWRDRLWLFHPESPFMQVAGLHRRLSKGPPKPWTQIALEHANGNNPVLFSHDVDAYPRRIPVASVLRQLLGYFQFAAGGPVKALAPDGFGRKGPVYDSVGVIAIGDTLAATLMLNLHPCPPDGSHDADRPAWEREPVTAASLKPASMLASGPNDRYTRPIRSVSIERCDDGLAAWVWFGEGFDLIDDEQAQDPMNAYRTSKDGHQVRLRFVAGRAVWRDLPSLLPTPGGSAWRAPAVLTWAYDLLDADGRPHDAVEVCVAGMTANQAKMEAVRLERYRLSAGLLNPGDASVLLGRLIGSCESVYEELVRIAVETFRMSLPSPDSKDARKLAMASVDKGPLGSTYFAHANQGMAGLLARISAGDDEGATAAWQADVRRAAIESWGAFGESLGTSVAALRAKAKTRPRFDALVYSLHQPEAGASSTTAQETA